MATRISSPQPGRTYIMQTSDGRTIVFTFVNIGHYRVSGRDYYVPNYGDLASPYTIASGPFEHNQPQPQPVAAGTTLSPGAAATKIPLTAAEIEDLKREGYFVGEVVDIEPIYYRWMNHRSGASQDDVKDRQPYRRSKAQAWVDCRNYTMGNYDSGLRADWLDN